MIVTGGDICPPPGNIVLCLTRRHALGTQTSLGISLSFMPRL